MNEDGLRATLKVPKINAASKEEYFSFFLLPVEIH
jgi:hypothetical protein